MTLTEDFDVYFRSEDFAVQAQVKIASDSRQFNIMGIFENSTEAVDVGTVGVETNNPTLTCPTEDVEDVVEGDTITIKSTAYTVRDVLPDKTGITVFTMDEVAT